MTGPTPPADAVPVTGAVPPAGTVRSTGLTGVSDPASAGDAPASGTVHNGRGPDSTGVAGGDGASVDSVPLGRVAHLVAPPVRESPGRDLPQRGGGPMESPSGGAMSRPANALDNHLGGVEAANYRRYEFDLIAPYCGDRLLEVGAGLGDFAAQFTDLEHLVLADSDPLCLEALRRRFAGRSEVEVVATDLSDANGPLSLDEPVDTVVAINVLEHIEDDERALRGLTGLLVPGGRIVCWVPGYPALYGDFDRSVGHFRRYTPASARAAAERAGLRVELARPVNILGGIAWWAAVRLGRQGDPSPRLVEFYDQYVVPATRAIESRIRVPFGQSVLFVARVPISPRS
ncbi:MAG: class I SAM-dependent methyltransferase [Frankia sp.]